MESKQPLHDLGFRKPSKKKRSRKGAGKKPPIQPPTSTTLEGLMNRYQNMLQYPPPDAPPDTDIHIGGHNDAIEKGNEGFTHYLTGKWREGYPKAVVE